eukprot:9471651-Alexandrium_andersonii.AAC.1
MLPGPPPDPPLMLQQGTLPTRTTGRSLRRSSSEARRCESSTSEATATAASAPSAQRTASRTVPRLSRR